MAFNSQIPGSDFRVWNEEAWEHFVTRMPEQMDAPEAGMFFYEQDRLEGRIHALVSHEIASMVVASRKADECKGAAKLAADARISQEAKPTQEPRIHLCHVKGCEEKYTRKPQLRKHIIKVHGSEHLEDLKMPSKEEKGHPCPHSDCKSGFSRPADLLKHRIEKHGEVLERRRRIPDDKKLFICKICEAKLSTKKILANHVKKQHK